MFVDKVERPQGEAVKITKLSQAIRIGAQTVPESRMWQGCALGTAAKAMGWDGMEDPYSCTRYLIHSLLSPFGLSDKELWAISSRHYLGLATRLEIAAELEARGL